MRKVLQAFRDGENGVPFDDERAHDYAKGKDYPAEGIEVSDEHIDYLINCDFNGNGPVIEAGEDDEAAKKAAEVEAKKPTAAEKKAAKEAAAAEGEAKKE